MFAAENKVKQKTDRWRQNEFFYWLVGFSFKTLVDWLLKFVRQMLERFKTYQVSSVMIKGARLLETLYI